MGSDLSSASAVDARLPAHDERADGPPRDVDTPRTFPRFASLQEWGSHREEIRRRILVSLGLDPLPERGSLHARVFDRVTREGYSIEKVSIQPHPGLYLAGNLYRPVPDDRFLNADSRAPYPGVLVAHGHGAQGRMTDTPDFSIPARAITFARQGYVAFTYDMVGYNDTRQVDHRFADDREHWLWSISLMGLQTWNSLRALDFLESLPDVDPHRLAMTGESGGGTQTFMLAAIDDRLSAVGPCVMVSHSMQGGCRCENAPGLRIDLSNMEIAAAAAPRPQIMVAATGDWTRSMLEVEGPAVESIYHLYGAADRLEYPIFNAGHNINKESREAVYRFFGKWLLHHPDPSGLEEPPYRMEPVEDLRVFPDHQPLPSDAMNAAELTSFLSDLSEKSLERHWPHDSATLAEFRESYYPLWRQTLALEIPRGSDLLVEQQASEVIRGGTLIRLNLGREGRRDNIPTALLLPSRPEPHSAAILIDPAGRTAFMDLKERQPGPLAASLLQNGWAVLLLDAFLTGERADMEASVRRRSDEAFFTTYNRTDLQERTQDIVTACAYLRSRPGMKRISLTGFGQAGLWALLAAPVADAAAADCGGLDFRTDEELLHDELYVPGLRRMGDLRTAAALAAPRPLLLFRASEKLSSSDWIRRAYTSAGAREALRIESEAPAEEDLMQWLTEWTG